MSQGVYKGPFILGILSESDICWLREVGTIEEIPAGTILIEGGKPLNSFYIILGGTLSVSVQEPEPHEITQISVGEVLGEMSFVDTTPPLATVTAIEDCLILSVSHYKLASKFQQDTGFAYRFYRAIALFLSSRLRQTTAQLGYGGTHE